MYTKLPMGKWGWYAEKLKNEKTLDKKVKVKLAVMLKHICVCRNAQRIVITHIKNWEPQDNSVKWNNAKRSCRGVSFIQFFLKEK